MEINKQLFEDVLAGKLKGTFVLRNKVRIETKFLMKSNFESLGFLYKLHYLDAIYAEYTEYGKASNCAGSDFDIIDFIPDTNMKENELTIEIPDGKIVDWDESKKQNKVVLKDKQLTYEEICEKLFQPNGGYHICGNGEIVSSFCTDPNTINATSKHQLECILAKNKLANVAMYLNDGWKPSCFIFGYFICVCNTKLEIRDRDDYKFNNNVIFKTKELAKQAIEILGEETVKLALEPLGI